MSQIADTAGPRMELRKVANGIEVRLLRSMIAAVTIAAGICVFAAPWRVTTGLILGGTLSILNYRWLHTSVAAIFSVNLAAERPRAGVSRYLLRYFVVFGAVVAAVTLQLVSLPAILAGLCAFVPALFVEAVREFYFAIIHREESF
ncbi:MAG TPA: ATP synthase subunit I [Pyrinomonadaceae bacterium]|nr:ATP synthase subunit I [Pyrinomonadaceae bacterium]